MGASSYAVPDVCPNVRMLGTERGAEVTLVRPSNTGAGLGTSIRYAVSVTSSANGSPVAIRGSAPLLQAGMSLGFTTPTRGTDEQTSCAPLVSVGSSPAGALYAIDWSLGCQNAGGCSTPASGTGCAAVRQFGPFLIVVVELGTFSPSPSPASPAYGSGFKQLTARSLKGDLIKIAGDNMAQAGTAVAACGNAPKAQYSGTSRGETLIRPALPRLRPSSRLGFDLNTRGLAYEWTISIDVWAQGKIRSLALQAPPPGSFFAAELPDVAESAESDPNAPSRRLDRTQLWPALLLLSAGLALANNEQLWGVDCGDRVRQPELRGHDSMTATIAARHLKGRARARTQSAPTTSSFRAG